VVPSAWDRPVCSGVLSQHHLDPPKQAHLQTLHWPAHLVRPPKAGQTPLSSVSTGAQCPLLDFSPNPWTRSRPYPGSADSWLGSPGQPTGFSGPQFLISEVGMTTGTVGYGCSNDPQLKTTVPAGISGLPGGPALILPPWTPGLHLPTVHCRCGRAALSWGVCSDCTNPLWAYKILMLALPEVHGLLSTLSPFWQSPRSSAEGQRPGGGGLGGAKSVPRLTIIRPQACDVMPR
jgi:hypothetical protein